MNKRISKCIVENDIEKKKKGSGRRPEEPKTRERVYVKD